MTNRKLNVLVVGATGSIGSLAVEEAIRQGTQCEHSCAARPKPVSFLVKPKR
jgi:uncharacterized protein YbjT (DUF2867 family)